MEAKLYAHVGNDGMEADRIVVENYTGKAGKDNVRLTAMMGFPVPEEKTISIKKVTEKKGNLEIVFDAFQPRGDFFVKGPGLNLNKDSFETIVEGEDKFEAVSENGIHYRLYSPQSSEPRPLILFLHGGGEGGEDNCIQLRHTLGAIKIAQMYPDMYVMAPQTPSTPLSAGKPMPKFVFATSYVPGQEGWTRPILASVCDSIRKMISDGKVDANRVYVTGLSMGGAGTLRAMSVGAGLFTACAPICPTMTPETFKILCGLTDAKIWISTAYVDHTIYRHKYIVDGIMALKDAGNKNAHLTLYSPEELEKYGIREQEGMPLQALFGANHASWILTYNNEHGIMSWLTEQTK